MNDISIPRFLRPSLLDDPDEEMKLAAFRARAFGTGEPVDDGTSVYFGTSTISPRLADGDARFVEDAGLAPQAADGETAGGVTARVVTIYVEDPAVLARQGRTPLPLSPDRPAAASRPGLLPGDTPAEIPNPPQGRRPIGGAGTEPGSDPDGRKGSR